MKIAKILVAGVTVLSFSNFALAGGRHAAKGGKHGHDIPMEESFHPEKLKNLNLTKEQEDKIKEIRESKKNGDKSKNRGAIKEARKKFTEVLKSAASKEEVLKAYEEMKSARSNKESQRIERLIEFREVLTPEQRAKLFDKE